MTGKRNSSTTTASYLLILGGILAILPNIPSINEILPIYRFEAFGFKGGVHFLGRFGTFQNIFTINGWTALSLPGESMWLIFVIIGALSILIGIILKTPALMKLTGIIGGLLGLILLILVYLGDRTDLNKYGISNLNDSVEFIGLGFWIMLLGCILIFASGLMLAKEN
jgi:hypothetical protein